MIKAILLSVRLTWNIDKRRVFYEIFYNMIKQFFNIFYGVYFLRTLLVYIETGNDLFSILCILCFMLAVNITFYFTNTHFKEVYLPRFELKLSEYIYEKIVTQATNVSYDVYNDPKFLDKYKRVIDNTVPSVKRILGSLGTMVGLLLALIMIAVYIIPVDFFAMLLSLVPIIYSYFISEKSEKYQFKLNKETTISNRKKEYANRIFYLPQFAKEIKLTSISNAIKALFDEGVNEKIEKQKKIGPKIAFFRIVELCVGDILIIMLPIAYVAVRVMLGSKLLIGDFIGIAQSINYFGWDIEWFFDLVLEIKSASFYIEEYIDYFDENCANVIDNSKEVKKQLDEELDVQLSCHEVSYAYPGSKDNVFAIHDINLSIKKGEKIAIVGENGAGKTTLVYLLMHLLSCTKGTINLCGQNIETFRHEQLKSFFGVILQDFNLYPISVRDNININGTINDSEIWNALDKVGLTDKVTNLNTRITREFSDDGLELSGGQQQKMALCRVIANHYPFVILDEPTSALDPLTEQEIYQLLAQTLSDRTMLFISHRLATTQFVDRILVMKDGTIVETGSHNELMKKNGYYSYLYTLQENMYKEVGK